MKVSRPRDLPEFRLWLMHQWDEGELFWQVANRVGKNHHVPDEHWATIEAHFDGNVLPTAHLYWVTPEMCALIDKASRTLPPTTLTDELVPSPEGLVWFEQPLAGLPAEDIVGKDPDFDVIPVRAILWGTSIILPGPHEAIGVATYAEHRGRFSPAGRTDWDWGADSDAPIDEIIKDDKQRLESMAEDRRWIATFWLLLSQGGIAETSIVQAQPQVVRRAKRRVPGMSKLLSDVRVIDVHAPKRAPAPSDGEGHKIDWTHRWIVQPFWRQQAYGPRHSLRRPMLIGPYVKGPDDKPLIIKDTVHVLKGN